MSRYGTLFEGFFFLIYFQNGIFFFLRKFLIRCILNYTARDCNSKGVTLTLAVSFL
jgi:hypothetical protein